MKKLFFLCAAGLLFYSCNDQAKSDTATDAVKDSTATDAKAKVAEVALPYAVSYSSKFEIGDPENAKKILDLWKDFDNNTLDNSKAMFADSVTMQLADGSTMKGPRDTIIAGAKGYRGMFASVTSSVDAVTSLKSIDKGENWVNIWGKEVTVDKKGKKDSSALQENWMLNKDGKVAWMIQFRAKAWKN